MSRSLMNKATWVLLAVTGTVLNSAEPGGEQCPRADLDGDCDVDLRDYAVFQAEFTGSPAFDPVGGVWDVFVFFLDPPHQPYVYFGNLQFYRSGVVIADAGELPGALFYSRDADGVTLNFVGWNYCGSSAPSLDLQSVNADVMESVVLLDPRTNGCQRYYFRALRRS